MEDARFQDWLAEWSATWSLPRLVDGIELRYSNRLRTSLGRCSPRSGSIRLHPGLREEGEALLREVVCHEVAHVATWRLYGPGARPHGPEWQALMRAAGYEPRTCADPATLPERFRRARPRFRHRCPRCRIASDAGRPMRRWRCRRCREAGRDGKLQISRR